MAQRPGMRGAPGAGALRILLLNRVEIGVHRRLRVHDQGALAGEVDDEVGALPLLPVGPGASELLGEVHVLEHARGLDDPAQLHLAPSAPRGRGAQRGGERGGALFEGLGPPPQLAEVIAQRPFGLGACRLGAGQVPLELGEGRGQRREGALQLGLALLLGGVAPGDVPLVALVGQAQQAIGRFLARAALCVRGAHALAQHEERHGRAEQRAEDETQQEHRGSAHGISTTRRCDSRADPRARRAARQSRGAAAGCPVTAGLGVPATGGSQISSGSSSIVVSSMRHAPSCSTSS